MPEVVLLKCVNTRSVFKFVALSDHKLRFERPFGKQKTVDADFLKKQKTSVLPVSVSVNCGYTANTDNSYLQYQVIYT